MVGTRPHPRRICRWLPLLAGLSGCVPDLSNLNDGEGASGGELLNDPRAGAATIAGSSGASGGGTGSAAGSGGAAAGGSSGSGAASGGSGGAAQPPQCVPQGAESCDGEDDDCNGVIDDGCPSGLSTVFDEDLPEIGDSQGGSKFTDDCADGSVLVGIAIGMDGFLGQVQGICRKLQLARSANVTSGYEVKLVDEATLAPHPPTTTNPITKSQCNENETLVAIALSQQYVTRSDGSKFPVIPQVTLSCAKLIVVKQGDAYSITWEGKREMAPVTGTYANGTAWFVDTSIASGRVATRLGGASGSWIDRLALGVSSVVIARAQ